MNKDTILILGASSDFGCEIIRQISNSNNIILAHYNESEKKIKDIQSELSGNIIPLKSNFQNEEEVMKLIDYIIKNYSFPNKIIHLPAERMRNVRFKDICWDDFQKDINVQLKSIVLILKTFLPLMSKDKYGKVIFMLSSCTLNVPPKALAHYVTVKHALLGLAKSLAAEYADKQININSISPSMTETNFLNNIPHKIVELEAETHPFKRNAAPKDIVPLVKFLLSDESKFITGVNIPVTGGIVF